MNLLLKLSGNDFKLIFRDASLRFFLALPLLIFLVVNYFVPYLISKFPVVKDYLPYIFMAATIQIVQMFGFIYAMVFIDEKDTQVAKVYGILPVNKSGFTLGRLIIPIAISILVTYALLIWQPFYQFGLMQRLGITFQISVLSLAYPLVIAILSSNKMEGMTWVKGINIIVILPLLTYFVPDTYAYFFGIFPTYWLFELTRLAINGVFSTIHFVVGSVYLGLVVFLGIRLFVKQHFL